MKKKIALLLLAAMLFALPSCGEKPAEEPAQAAQTEFESEECGLSFTIPAIWTTMENSSLVPASFVNPDGEIYAKILYQYISDDNMDLLNDPASSIPAEELMAPLVEFLVVKEENLESETVDAELALFRSMKVLPERDGYHFYFLSDPNFSFNHFSDEAKAVYRELAESLPELLESTSTSVPDEAAVRAAAEENSKYLNFISTTLEGDPISSTVFYDYDLTVVNFWASYCYPDINELDTLQEFYQQLQKKHPNVNFLQIVIDTPAEEAEEIIAKAYEEAGVRFTSIMPDQNLAAWIMENLAGLPTTVFVDAQGKPFDLRIEGVQDAAYYMEITESMLEDMQ